MQDNQLQIILNLFLLRSVMVLLKLWVWLGVWIAILKVH